MREGDTVQKVWRKTNKLIRMAEKANCAILPHAGFWSNPEASGSDSSHFAAASLFVVAAAADPRGGTLLSGYWFSLFFFFFLDIL